MRANQFEQSKMNQEEEITDTEWIGGEHLYRDPDYVGGSHPMDTDDVTWHHHWLDQDLLPPKATVQASPNLRAD